MLERAGLADPEHRHALLSAGFKAWDRIARHWELTGDEQLRLVPALHGDAPLEGIELRDLATKLGMMIGIYRRLRIMYSERFAHAWVKLPNTNPLFGGKRPVDFMIEGGIPSMAKVASLLEGRIGIGSRL
jgi:hypothetical protein